MPPEILIFAAQYHSAPLISVPAPCLLPPKKPRIAIDARTILRPKTGDRTYTLGLLQGLARVPGEFEFDVLLDAPDSEQIIARATGESPLFTTHVLPAHSGRIWSLLALPRWAWQHKPALVHVQYLAPGALPCPFVTTIHDVVWRVLPHTFPARDRAVMNLGMPLSARRARLILTESRSSKNEIARTLRVSRDKIALTTIGIDARFRAPVAPVAIEDLRRKYGLGDAPYVLSVGVLQPRKNIARLMQAFGFEKKARPELPHQLVVTGKTGWGAAPAITEGVRFTGYVEDDELPALYAGADLFAYPSLYEGFGLPILEAMAAGAPVLTSNRASMPEVAGDAAVKVDPYDVNSIRDGLGLLLRDADLRDELRARGRVWSQHFTVETQARDTLKAYRRALSHSPQSPQLMADDD